jgi:hypothetical protein
VNSFLPKVQQLDLDSAWYGTSACDCDLVYRVIKLQPSLTMRRGEQQKVTTRPVILDFGFASAAHQVC